MPAPAPFVAALAILAPHHSHHVAAPALAQLTSPRLQILSGKRIAVALPTGWTIQQKDPESNWGSDYYSFIAAHGSGKNAETRRIDVVMHVIPPGPFHGAFAGIPFTTLGGAKGVGSVDSGKPGEKIWHATLLPTKQMPRGYLDVKIHFDGVKAEQQRRFATFVFYKLRYAK